MSNPIDSYVEEDCNEDNRISLFVEFWLYLISNILSILCCLFVLFYLLFDRSLRNALHNHIIIVLLIICLINELIGAPLYLYNSYFGVSEQVAVIFYRIWSFIDIGLYTTQLIMFAWAIVERHILVFHPQYFLTGKNRFSMHYLPIFLLLIYCIAWYSAVILYPSCSNSEESFHLCLTHNSNIKYFDFLCHQMLPTLIIIIGSTALLVRSRSASTTDQSMQIFQIVSITILYLIFCGPWLIVLIFYQLHSLENIGAKLNPYAYFFSHYFTFLLPFICLTSLPEVYFKLRTLFYRHRR